MPSCRAAASWRRWLLLVAIVLLSGCSHTHHHRVIEISDTAVVDAPAPECRVALLELEDAVGQRVLRGAGGHTYEITDLAARIEQQVRSWRPPSGADADLEFRLRLVRAYADLKRTNTYFHTVLVATEPNGEREVLRGTFRQFNWWASQNEFMRAVDHSVELVLAELSSWLDRQCGKASSVQKPAETRTHMILRS